MKESEGFGSLTFARLQDAERKQPGHPRAAEDPFAAHAPARAPELHIIAHPPRKRRPSRLDQAARRALVRLDERRARNLGVRALAIAAVAAAAAAATLTTTVTHVG